MVASPCDESLSYLSLTVARYAADDPLGKVAALITLSPIYLGAAYATLSLCRRDLQTFIMGVGQALDLVVNKVAKNWAAEPRPQGCVTGGYGMPSNHTQFMFFFAAFSILYLWNRLSCSTCTKAGLSLGLGLWAALVGWTRQDRVVSFCLHLSCHTPMQVVVGGVLGSGTGALWYLIYQEVLMPLSPSVVKWPLCRALLVKDYSQVSNVLAFEHENLHGAEGLANGWKLQGKLA
ncbi:unnamed protein product [Choristocarpus tenellus]